MSQMLVMLDRWLEERDMSRSEFIEKAKEAGYEEGDEDLDSVMDGDMNPCVTIVHYAQIVLGVTNHQVRELWVAAIADAEAGLYEKERAS